jgi:hypothetical protein
MQKSRGIGTYETTIVMNKITEQPPIVVAIETLNDSIHCAKQIEKYDFIPPNTTNLRQD